MSLSLSCFFIPPVSLNQDFRKLCLGLRIAPAPLMMMMVVNGFVPVSIVQVRVEIRNRNLISHSRFIFSHHHKLSQNKYHINALISNLAMNKVILCDLLKWLEKYYFILSTVYLSTALECAGKSGSNPRNQPSLIMISFVRWTLFQ